MRLFPIAAALLGLAPFAHGQAYCLLVQERLSPNPDAGLDLELASLLADELARDGRVTPVVWSMADLVFRGWVADGVAPADRPHGDVRDAQAVARRLKIPFVVSIQAVRLGTALRARIELVQGARTTWSQGKRVTPQEIERSLSGDPASTPESSESVVYVGGRPDWDASARAVAHSWARLLTEGPLRALPRSAAPGPSPAGLAGLAPPSETTVVTNPAAEAEAALAEGRPARAVLLLREAIDREPSDARLRLRLSEALLSAGMPLEAAREARQASKFGVAAPEPWLLAARASLEAGDGEAAREDLREALARGASPPSVGPIRARIDLLLGDPQGALDGLPSVADAGPRALALALLGRLDELRETVPDPLLLDPADYALTSLAIDRALLRWLDDLRSIPPAVRLRPGAPEAQALAETAVVRFESLSLLLSRIQPPLAFTASHEGRRLAHVMLLQSAMDAARFARTQDPADAEEAAVSMVQALRLLDQARDRYRGEHAATRSR